MSLYHNRIGPWPIKRSQSVPDASAPLLTSGNSPSSLSRLLIEVEEERSLLEPRQTPSFSSKPQFRTTKWFSDSRYQRSVDLEKNISSRKACRESKTTALDDEAAVLKSTIIVGLSVFVIVPAHITSFFRDTEPFQLTLPNNAPSAVLLYLFICLLAIMVGMIASIAWSGAKPGNNNEQAPKRSKRAVATSGLIMGTLLSVWWTCIVLPPIVRGPAESYS